MKMTKIYAMLAILLITSCEKYLNADVPSSSQEGNGNVTLHITTYEPPSLTPFYSPNYSRSSDTTDDVLSLSDICQKLSFAVFDGNEKVKTITQSTSDKAFGTITLSLQEGNYDIVVIAHNGTGNCTISTPEKITFANNKVTDTFYYYGNLDVTEDDNIDKDIKLTRAVGMFRLHIKDDIADEAKQLKFYYTGGSSTFNAVTGYGCVNSKQTEYRTLEKDIKNYDVYTFPHNPTKVIKLEITAQNASGTTIASKLFEDVTVKRNFITNYSGNFFTDTPGSEGGNTGFHFTFDYKWEGSEETAF